MTRQKKRFSVIVAIICCAIVAVCAYFYWWVFIDEIKMSNNSFAQCAFLGNGKTQEELDAQRVKYKCNEIKTKAGCQNLKPYCMWAEYP